MNTNRAGIDLIKRFESLQVRAYLPTPNDVLTIGYGHTGPDVRKGMVITEERAEELLTQDLTRFENAVATSLGGAETTENQFSAMVSLAFNIGIGAFKSSSVLRFHREGKTEQAAAAFIMWNKQAGKVLAGLSRRRNAERDLYLRR